MTLRRGTTVAVAVTLAWAAVRCSVNVPLGVDPRSDASDNLTDGSAGAGN